MSGWLMAEFFRLKGLKEGPHLLIFGAIHGNEPCGAAGIGKCIELLKTRFWQLQAGTLTLVPVCNPRAFEQKKRYTEENLNRVFCKHDHPKSYEQGLANELTALVDECDYLLDLHSQSSKGQPFVFEDYEDPQTIAFARTLGPAIILKGWPEMYADRPDLNAGDTTGYAHAQGKITALIECGQHDDPGGPAIAFAAIENALAHLGMIDAVKAAANKISTVVRGRKVYTVPPEGGKLTQNWQHLQDVANGQELAVSSTGQTIRAPENSVVILPKSWAGPGEEWFYLGTRED
jgi:predicted deacylase